MADGQEAGRDELFLRAITLRRDTVPSLDEYPFSLPAIQSLGRMELVSPVTIFVGENGVGKSTLLEGIAVAWGFNPEGGSRNFEFSTRASHSGLWRHLRLTKKPIRPNDGYFLRAESFFNLATEIERLDQDEDCPDPKIIDSYGGRSLHEQSHGEAFMALLLERFQAPGFFVLDEPEAALSPTRLFALLARMHELVRQGSQFVIATHSPIVMAYPGADVLVLSERGMIRTLWQETDHVRITREFLNHPEAVLRELLGERRRTVRKRADRR